MKHFVSSDFYLSAVCLACDCKIQKLIRKDSKFVEFFFQDSPDKCLEIISSYWAGELLVDPKKLISAINELKTRIHEGN
jgi:hypothetical protein